MAWCIGGFFKSPPFTLRLDIVKGLACGVACHLLLSFTSYCPLPISLQDMPCLFRIN